MKIDYVVRQLDEPQSWLGLEEVLGNSESPIVKSIIRHLRILGTESYLIESHYIDKDYSTDYLQFYAQTFQSYNRHCKRVHFFSGDISKLTESSSEAKIAEIQKFTENHYCGFCVVRPLSTAPIGRTVLKARVRGYSNMEATVTCHANLDANLFGVDLQVRGTSFLQQDSRVGACAQVAIWMGMRHMHVRHKYNWVSVADITQLAAPTTSSESVSLPAGSDFLTSERMIRAINEVGFQPLCFRGDGAAIGAAILPYVESGIPVILGLKLNERLGHAVTVIGRVFSEQKCPTSKAIDYIPAYIVHDDQVGPYMWLPMNEDTSVRFSLEREDLVRRRRDGKKVELSVEKHATFAVALMPKKVFSTAQAAEYTAQDRINEVMRAMSEVRKNLLAKESKVNERLMDELESAYENGEIVLRTYLTSAGGYRRYIAKSTACRKLKEVLLGLSLPHFTWVTEISTTGSYNQFSPGMRRIYGHTVLDATSTGKDKSGLLLLHVPGFVLTNDVNAPAAEQEKVVLIEDDKLYECREKCF